MISIAQFHMYFKSLCPFYNYKYLQFNKLTSIPDSLLEGLTSLQKL